MAAAAFEALAGTRPRIRRDVLYTETPGGVLFHNADGGFHLTGRTAYRFASLLVPHLDGRHSLADICEGFPDAQRAMAAGLLRTLYERGFARDTGNEMQAVLEDGPQAAAASRFEAQIAYIDHYTGDAHRRFRRFRATRVAVLGRGEVARWCALSLLRNGSARLGVQHDRAELADELRELADDGCPARVDRIPADGAGRWDALKGYDVVVVTGPDAAVRTHRLLAEGVPEGRTLIPSWTFGDRAVTGPLSTHGGSGCWSCALLRLGAAQDPGAAARLWSEVAAGAVSSLPPTDGPLYGPVAAMTGNLLGYEVFRLATGALPAETDRQVLIQDPESLDVLAEPVWPHPRCRHCADPADPAGETARVLADGPAVARTATVDTARDAERAVEDLHALGSALVRPYTGVFTRYDDEELTQTPLKVSRVEVPLGAGGRRLIAAFDVHHLAGARVRALHAAATAYVEHMVPVGADQVTATSLFTKETVRVPAAAVRPFGPYNHERTYPATRAGAGAGGTPGEAAGSALLSALAYDSLLRAVRGTATVTVLTAGAPEAAAGVRVEGAVEEADPELVFLRKSARTLGTGAELLDLGECGRSSAHVVLAREPDGEGSAGRWAVACDLSRTGAANAALRDLLGQVQLAAESGAGARPGAVDTGDPLLADLHPGTLAVTAEACDGPAGADTTWERVLDRLRADGRDVLLVPTTPADLRAGGLSTARVLLTGGGPDARD